jgi:Skp family chaperone for outer membrane proteins
MLFSIFFTMLMKKTIGILFSFLVLFFLSTVSANAILENSSSSGRMNPRATVIEERQEVKGNLREIKGELRDERASVSAEIQAKRDEFKLKLAMIKDARKQQVLERVASKSAEINKKRTDQMMEVLNKMTVILERIANFQFQIPNSKLDGLIVTARTAIETAKSAVTAQSQKDYTITITTESALRTTVGQMMLQLENDLRLTREKVILARKAVNDVFSEFMKLKGEKEASPSSKITNY